MLVGWVGACDGLMLQTRQEDYVVETWVKDVNLQNYPGGGDVQSPPRDVNIGPDIMPEPADGPPPLQRPATRKAPIAKKDNKTKNAKDKNNKASAKDHKNKMSK